MPFIRFVTEMLKAALSIFFSWFSPSPDVYSANRLRGPRDIRLIRLADGDLDDDLRCDMRVVCLDDAIEYDALSYVWGDPAKVGSIYCNGYATAITSNLGVALLRLRSMNAMQRRGLDRGRRTRWLWIDALCINQDDDAERSSQVQLMGNIYRRAKSAMAWLGDLGDERKPLFTMINRFTTAWVARAERLRAGVGGISVEDIRLRLSDRERRDFPAPEEPIVRTLMDFFKRPWFSRTWTFQEAILAPELVFLIGHDEITCGAMAATLMGVMNLGYYKNEADNFFLDTLITFATTLAFAALENRLEETWCDGRATLSQMLALHPEEFFSLSRLLEFTNRRRTSDARDKIFGLLGLIGARNEPLLRVDYRKPMEHVFRDAARYCIEREGNLHIFSGLQNCNQAGLPSWVPDWSLIEPHPGISRTGSVDPTELLKQDPIRYYSASRNSRVCVKPSTQANHLRLRGKLLWRIKRVTLGGALLDEARNSVGIGRTHVMTLKAYHFMAKRVGVPHMFSKPKTFASSFQQLIVAERFPTCPRWKSLMYPIGVFPAALAWRRKGCKQPCPREVFTEYDERARGMLLRRSIFSTEDYAHVGICHESARPGDWVCILFGGDVPYIMRPKGTWADEQAGDMEWQLLGECYVQGIMDGQGMDAVTGEEDWTDFTIV